MKSQLLIEFQTKTIRVLGEILSTDTSHISEGNLSNISWGNISNISWGNISDIPECMHLWRIEGRSIKD